MADRGNMRRRRHPAAAAARRRGGPAPPKPADPFDGVLVVDKPAGPTSHDVVAGIRRAFGFRKVGHGGTLDPMATGVLIILLGRGTKLSNHFIGSDKTYEGTMLLGVATDSHDVDGTVTSEADCSTVTRKQVEAEMEKLTGDLLQVPPMVSAVKVKGVPLYKHARKGRTVERDPRLIHVYEFSLLDFRPPRADLRLRCTKGTYVRKLCADVGEGLGCGACLEELRRTGSGEIRVSDAVALEDVLRMDRDELVKLIIPIRKFTNYRSGAAS
jgi:tRNA pseudouridine55 synthase